MNTRHHGTVRYLTHVHGQAVVDLFAGDDLYGVDMSLPIHERVEEAKSRSQKIVLTRSLRLLRAGSRREEKKKSGGRGRGGSQQQQQQQ